MGEAAVPDYEQYGMGSESGFFGQRPFSERWPMVWMIGCGRCREVYLIPKQGMPCQEAVERFTRTGYRIEDNRVTCGDCLTLDDDARREGER